MQIERNLYSPLRSLIERVVEASEEFTSNQVQVDKDKGGNGQEQQTSSHHELEEKNSDQEDKQETADLRSPKPVLARRLDLIA